MLIKPDATARCLTDEINQIVEASGFCIVKRRVFQMTLAEARLFKSEQSALPIYDKICAYLSSAPVVAQILEGEDAVRRFRVLMGAGTNPRQAPEGSLRRRFAEDVLRNAVHASNSPEEVEHDISLFFGNEACRVDAAKVA